MLGRLSMVVLLAFLCAQQARANGAPTLQAAEDAASNGKYDVAIQISSDALRDARLSANERARLLAVRAEALIFEDKPVDAERELKLAIDEAIDKDTRAVVMDTAAQAYRGHGDDYFTNQDWKKAIDNYTNALNYDYEDDGLYEERGYAYLLNMEIDKGIDDLYRAVDINDASADNYRDLGAGHELKLDFVRSVQDYSDAISRDTRNGDFVFDRGRAYAIIGNFDAARRDLERADAMQPGDPPTIMWLHIVHMHSNVDDSSWLKRRTAKLSENQWPTPAILYFVGKKSASEIVDIAFHSPETIKAYQRCDAWFYLGEDDLHLNKLSDARSMFQKTVQNCNAVDFEWPAAKMELQRLQ